jgi:predicted  nucleic acid-binding Zn-ribbon protein
LKRPFQFRSVQRDAQTDLERIGSVIQAISAAVGSAQKERDALRDRVSAARDLASFATGTGDDEYLTREAKDKSRIEEYERQMIIGEKRIRELDQQIASLAALQELSRRCFPESME